MSFSATQWIRSPKSVRSDQAIYAIGDVHGHADELRAMHAVLLAEIVSRPILHHVVVHLGDYIDRGPDSRGVIDILSKPNCLDGRANVEQQCLVGNHDQYLVELLGADAGLDREFVRAWYDNGGEATMQSLQVEGYGRLLDKGDVLELSARVRAALGLQAIEWLDTLVPMFRMDDYLFVHAGIDPAISIEQQDFVDLLMIREPFLSGQPDWPHPFCVVHGHSISVPSVHPHRISVDAGCYRYGALCAVQMVRDQLRFVAVSSRADDTWLRKLTDMTGTGRWNWQKPAPVVMPTLR